MDLRQHARKHFINPKDRILEFGPLIWPMVTRADYPNAYYSDIRSGEDIKKLYSSNEYLKSTGITVDIDKIIDIDYVIKGTYKETFKNVEKFDVVLLSHVIEHIPDIIFFFQDLPNVLKENGKVVIIYPDARYCFDRFRNGSTFIDAYDVYKNNENSSKRVFDFTYNVVKQNDPFFFWGDKKQNNILPKNDFKDSLATYEKALKNELPDDTHFWPFADYQFVKFLYDMDRAGLLSFEIDDFYQTQENTQEYMLCLKLKKDKKINHSGYAKILNTISPANKEIMFKEKIKKMQTELTAVDSENQRINKELEAILGSKKWKYAHKLGDMKARITRKNGKK